jgi:hypothetical protein
MQLSAEPLACRANPQRGTPVLVSYEAVARRDSRERDGLAAVGLGGSKFQFHARRAAPHAVTSVHPIKRAYVHEHQCV